MAIACFNSQPREGGWKGKPRGLLTYAVSTRSHAKAAGFELAAITVYYEFQLAATRRRLGRPVFFKIKFYCFNSQPREGGWPAFCPWRCNNRCFNSQPREGGWDEIGVSEGQA